MNKRIVVALLAMLVASVSIVHAQQQKKFWRIGLSHVGLDHVPPSLEPLREGLKALGYEDGKNIRLDWRNLADEEAARSTAQEFVRDRVDLIVAFESQTVQAAKAATSDIPVVFLHVADPVAEGFIKSLSQPGGNMTGIVGTSDALVTKEIGLFKELHPKLKRLLVVHNPDDLRSAIFLPDVHKVAEGLKLRVVERTPRSNHREVEQAFASIKRGDVDGALALPGSHRAGSMSLLLRLTSERRIPMAVHRREWVEEGGLFSYGPDYGAVGKDAARYVDKILRGAKPSDLPVEQTMRFELIINLKTAKSLGLSLSSNVLARADRLIR